MLIISNIHGILQKHHFGTNNYSIAYIILYFAIFSISNNIIQFIFVRPLLIIIKSFFFAKNSSRDKTGLQKEVTGLQKEVTGQHAAKQIGRAILFSAGRIDI
jgi:hypothetical protein